MTTTARVTPAGIKPTDGHSTKIAFAADPDISFWEQTVKPPGIDGGDPIDNTTMHNTDWRTSAPRSLKTLTPMSLKALYDPEVLDQIEAIINIPGWITIHFFNLDTYDFYGFLKSFVPDDLAEGTAPSCTIEIVPTNTVPATGAEAGPVWTDTSGTP